MESFWKDTVDGSGFLPLLIGKFIPLFRGFLPSTVSQNHFLFKLSWPTQICLFNRNGAHETSPLIVVEHHLTKPSGGFMGMVTCVYLVMKFMVIHVYICLDLHTSCRVFLDTVLYLINSPFSKYFKI